MLDATKPPSRRLRLADRASPEAQSRFDLDDVVSALSESRDVTHSVRHRGRVRPMPSGASLSDIVDDLAVALFPSHYGQSERSVAFFDDFVRGTLTTTLGLLEEQVRRGLSITHDDHLSPEAIGAEALAITRRFAAALPAIRALLVDDLHAALESDPAASSTPEILLGYPGMAALIHYRLAHALHGLGAHLPARLIADVARSKTGIDIHPAATIGTALFIDHGTGLVIGETAIVGNRVRLHQGVTLGGRQEPGGRGNKGDPRHPIVDDDVVIHAGAALLGRITIGRGSVIDANVCLTASVPPGSRVVQAAAHRSGGEAQRLPN